MSRACKGRTGDGKQVALVLLRDGSCDSGDEEHPLPCRVTPLSFVSPTGGEADAHEERNSPTVTPGQSPPAGMKICPRGQCWRATYSRARSKSRTTVCSGCRAAPAVVAP